MPGHPILKAAGGQQRASLDVQAAHADMQELQRLGALADRDACFPSRSIALLAQRRLQFVFEGWRGDLQTSEVFDALRFVGRADLSVGRLVEGHINALQLIDWYGSSQQKAQARDNAHCGKLYGVWATEPPPGVTMTARNGHFEIAGKKSFASGAGHLDFAIVTAKSADAARVMVIVPANDQVRADISGWQVRGMRATLSGTYDLNGLRVSGESILGQPGDYDREPRFTVGAWRFLAVQLGGIEALVFEIREAMSDVARADPLQRLKFANAVASMRTVEFWVREAARLFEAGSHDAPAFVRLARGVVECAAADVMADAARIVGMRSAFDGQRIDKIIRDLSLYLRQAGPDYARDQAALAWLDRDVGRGEETRLW